MAEQLTEFGGEQLLDEFVTKGNRIQLWGLVKRVVNGVITYPSYYYTSLKPAAFTINSTGLPSVPAFFTLNTDIEFDVQIPTNEDGIEINGAILCNADGTRYFVANFQNFAEFSGDGKFTLTEFQVEFIQEAT